MPNSEPRFFNKNRIHTIHTETEEKEKKPFVNTNIDNSLQKLKHLLDKGNKQKKFLEKTLEDFGDQIRPKLSHFE